MSSSVSDVVEAVEVEPQQDLVPRVRVRINQLDALLDPVDGRVWTLNRKRETLLIMLPDSTLRHVKTSGREYGEFSKLGRYQFLFIFSFLYSYTNLS